MAAVSWDLEGSLRPPGRAAEQGGAKCVMGASGDCGYKGVCHEQRGRICRDLLMQEGVQIC